MTRLDAARVQAAGHCPTCYTTTGRAVQLQPGATLCSAHLVDPHWQPGSTGRAGSPAGPARRPGRRKASASTSWRRRFLRHSPVRKAPRPTGSRRPLSPERMEDHAALLAVQAISARRAYRPIAWLAVLMYDLDTHRPPGASRADARANIFRLAGLLATSADWRSGHRGRPGRQVSAAVVGCCERTVERHWSLIQRRDLADRANEGELLDAAQRAAVLDDEDATADQRRRWVNRAEWSLRIPHWVRDLTDEQIWPYIERAAQLLDELAAPARGTAVDNAVGSAVDNQTAHQQRTGSVAPSISFDVLTSLPVHRSTFSLRPRTAKRLLASSHRQPKTQRETPKGGASRPASTTEAGPNQGRRAPHQTVQAARELAASKRLPFLAGVDLPLICNVLRRFPGWTARDVEAAAAQRLADCGKAMFAAPDRPVSYLKWLLSKADPAHPPAREAEEWSERAHAARVERAQAQRQAYAQRAAAAVPADYSPGGLHARHVAATAREMAATSRPRYPRPTPPATEADAPGELACIGGCHTAGPHVQLHTSRETGRTFAYCPTCWDSVRHVF